MQTVRVKWDEFKAIINLSNPFREIDLTTSYNLITTDAGVQYQVFIHKDGDMDTEKDEYELKYQKYANTLFQPRSSDGLPTQSLNRIPFGYTIYETGISDDLAGGVYGAGTPLILDKDNLTVDFGLLNNWFAIGADATWDANTLIRDYVSAVLIAPKTVGVAGSGFDFTKVATGLGFNVFVPTAAGAGDWDIDTTNPLFTGKEYLKVTPVPVEGNTGFFDYDKKDCCLSVNATQQGGYNLYDADLPLFQFGRNLWGMEGGGVKIFKENEVVGKLIYANWLIRFSLTIHNLAGRAGAEPSAVLDMTTAVKKNL